MYEIEELEKKWEKYKSKKTLKKIYIVILVLFSLVFILLQNPKMYILSTNNKEIEKINKNNTAKIGKNQPQLTLKSKKDGTITKDENFQKILYLKPSLDIDKKTDQTSYNSTKNFVKQNRNQKNSEIKKDSLKENEFKKVIITSKDSNKVVSEIIKKFENKKDPKIAIFLSNLFYKKKEYKKALNWAIIANELDSSNDKSWILFAKASVKLNKKNQAIKALKIYLKTHPSYNVKVLLRKIINGEFK